MIEKKTLVAALSGVIVGGLLLSGGMTFASDAKSSNQYNQNGKMPFFGQKGHRGGMAPGKGDFGKAGGGPRLTQATLDQLVKEKAITQEKANEIKAYQDKLEQEMQARKSGLRPFGKSDLFADLVKNNILSQEQADNLKTKIQELAQKQKQQKMSDGLKAIVDKGTITQEQADKLLTKLETIPKDSISQLVSDGTITQDQAKALAKLFPAQHGPKRGRR